MATTKRPTQRQDKLSIQVRCTPEQYADLERYAEFHEQPVSTWLRAIGLMIARGKAQISAINDHVRQQAA